MLNWFTANVDVDVLTLTTANVGTYVGMLLTVPQTKSLKIAQNRSIIAQHDSISQFSSCVESF